MKQEGIFLGHLGLGDHIICQGIINHISPLYNKIELLAKHHNAQSVNYMCKNIDNVQVVGVANDDEAIAIVNNSPSRKIKIGAFGDNWRYQKFGFDKVFYEQVGLDMEQSFNWTTEDGRLGDTIVQDLYPKTDFCFVHDDSNRNFNINLATKLPIVRNSIKSETIFDYLPLIKMAKEVHCMDSSFALMIDRSAINSKNIFIHRSLRVSSGVPTYKKNWNIV